MHSSPQFVQRGRSHDMFILAILANWRIAPSVELIDDEHARFTLVRRRQGDSNPAVSLTTGVCRHGQEVKSTAKQHE